MTDHFDLTDPDLIQAGLPWEDIDRLRASEPVYWNPQPAGYGFDDGGLWLLTRHADVRDVSIHSEVFSSWANGAIVRFSEGMPREAIEMQRVMILNQDP